MQEQFIVSGMSIQKIPFFALAACDPNGVIGCRGSLPWHCPEDLRHFRETTWGQVMLMGYRTFLSMPEKAFEGRTSIVFSRNHAVRKDPKIFQVSGFESLDSLYCQHPRLLGHAQWVIGGEEVFKLFFREGLLREALMTHLFATYEGDTYFPLKELKGCQSQTVHKTSEYSLVRYFI